MYLNNFVKILGNNIECKCQHPFHIVKTKNHDSNCILQNKELFIIIVINIIYIIMELQYWHILWGFLYTSYNVNK